LTATPVATRTFRVFVSSTFEDLEPERNALQAEVFPVLRHLCEQHGGHFQAVDLRWGVRDEAALDQRTVEICLREIERCQQTGIKPNFTVLLGHRYGWRPLPARIEAGEFEAVWERIADASDRVLAGEWYGRDDNADPMEFLLRPRTGEWMDVERWRGMETRLHGILHAAAQAAGLNEDALVKYWASATHQEVLKGLGTTEADRQHVFAFCLNVPDDVCDPDLVDLRKFLKAQLRPENILFFEPNDVDGLCRSAEEELSKIIQSELRRVESQPGLELEKDAHDRFASERLPIFGREDVLKDVAGYLPGVGSRPLVLHGVPGCGKSSIMAQAWERARSSHPSAVVVRRFIGASPESSNGLTLLRSLCEQIGAEYGVRGETPLEFIATARVFAERLALATAERPLLVFLDALDQLGKDDPARSLFWVSTSLPSHCRMVLSTAELALTPSECELREIEPLSESDAGQALDYWLATAKRKLTIEQRQVLLAAFNRCGLPLYLKLAFEEARGWPSSLPSTQCSLGEGVEGIIVTLFDRLAEGANHGRLLVSRGLGYLAAARYGLSDDEILDVLSEDNDVWKDFRDRADHTPPEHRLPMIVWSRLHFDIQPYLTERSAPGGSVVTFFHRQFRDQVASRFLPGDRGVQSHASLATYFRRLADPTNDLRWTGTSIRAVFELPFHLARARKRIEMSALLQDFGFLEKKAGDGRVPAANSKPARSWMGAQDLLSDFDMCLEMDVEPAAQDVNPALRSLRKLLYNFAQFLDLRPDHIFQQCYNAAENGPLSLLAQSWLSAREIHYHTWVRRLNRPKESNPATRIFGLQSAVSGLEYTDDGRFLVGIAGSQPMGIWETSSNRLVAQVDTLALLFEYRVRHGYVAARRAEVTSANTITDAKRRTADWDAASREVPSMSSMPVNRESLRVQLRRNHGLAIAGGVVGLLLDEQYADSLLCLVSTQDLRPHVQSVGGARNLELLCASASHFLVVADGELLKLDPQGDIMDSICYLGAPKHLTVSRDGSHIAAINDFGKLEILSSYGDAWEPGPVSYLRRVDENLSLVLPGHEAVHGGQGLEYASLSLSLSACGDFLCCSLRAQDWPGEILLIDTKTLEIRNRLANYFGPARFSPDGSMVAFAANWVGPWKPLCLYHVASGTFEYLALPHSNFLSCVAFSLENRQVAAGSLDQTISIAAFDDAGPLELLTTQTPIRDSIVGGIVSPDRRRLSAGVSINMWLDTP